MNGEIRTLSKTPLYDHQKRAGEFVQDKESAALFMEIGTGKTLTAINIAIQSVYRGDITAFLIIAPKPLLGTWASELKIHAGITDVLRWDLVNEKTQKGKDAIVQGLKEPFVIVLINVEAFQYQNDAINAIMKALRLRSTFVLIDESVRIKEMSAKRTKNIISQTKGMAKKIIMTGTEVSSGLMGLYAQFEFLKDGFWKMYGYGNFYAYRARFAVMKQIKGPNGRMIDIIKRPDEMTGSERVRHEDNMKEINRIISPYVFRAKRDECLDLPAKIEETVLVELSKEERKAYNDMKNDAMIFLESGEVIEAINAISVYAKLRQVIGGSIGDKLLTERPAKLDALLDDIEDHDESAVIVAYFRQDIKIICEALKQEGYAFAVLHGDIKPADRDIAIDGFKSGKIRFLVGQHDLLAQGLNLQKNCALMYTYSVSLVAETQSQYQGRIDRNGQTRRPVFKHLIAKGTIDERIHKMIRSNLNVQRIFSSMSRKEMINLLLDD